MSNYKPTKRHLQEVILYYFNSRKSAGEIHRMLMYTYGNGIISRRTCYNLYESFKKGDFNLGKPTSKQLNKERVIEELVRLRLEDPCMTRAMMATKVGKSRMTVSRYLNSQEYKNKLEEKKQEQSSLPLERTTLKRQHRELEDEKLVRLIPENPRMSQDELAKQLEMSLPTASKGVNTQKIQNKLKETGLEPSSIPKKRRISRTPSTQLEDEKLARLIPENLRMSQDELTKQFGMSQPTTFKGVNSQKIQNELKEKVQEQSSILLERPTSRSPRTESEDEELVHFIDEFPGVTPEELANVHDISISGAERIIDPLKIEYE